MDSSSDGQFHLLAARLEKLDARGTPLLDPLIDLFVFVHFAPVESNQNSTHVALPFGLAQFDQLSHLGLRRNHDGLLQSVDDRLLFQHQTGWQSVRLGNGSSAAREKGSYSLGRPKR